MVKGTAFFILVRSAQFSSVQFSSCFELLNSQLSPQLNSHAKVPFDKFSTKVGVFPFLMSY